jgi:hypothetical protein
MSGKKSIAVICMSALFLFACSGHIAEFYVKVYRSNYQTGLDQAKYAEYKGQRISFYTIGIAADNVSTFNYYSNDGQIGYQLFFSPDKPWQPLSSFFWYSLQKAFENVGIEITPHGPIVDVPEFVLRFKSLTDQEAKFDIKLSRNKNLLFEKTLFVSQKLPPTRDVAELEKRSYTLFDLIAEAILNDPDFKREVSSNKTKI